MRMRLLVVGLLVAFMALTGCAKNQMSTEPGTQAGENAAVATDSQNSNGLSEQDLADQQRQAMAAAEQEITQNRIYFGFDKFDLDAEAKDVLKTKAEALKAHSEWKMLIEGHCDNRGTEEYNLALGERRARAAYEFLVMLGVPSSNLKIVSFGEERPAVDADNEAAWAKNRRDEFKLFK
ncbi:peptidoglycan-associated lipoprotein Pal [Desulfobaculum bizertense]|uniref:Peptidoglycan-associated lipoprotein n=1 Tax=Desulfobaculum bizertense DSM 18034 TaxID=1121442 RepID=A0A1T4VND2_9BACT|nr:peptidoglycan-associated lipoprotein Pal [Desulfobaculum bizertense]UIJ38125.1 peptidoglycan-associated lipoprotein Pal [Desulfobaculum bizertense]SKA66473.1 peptidoglycan-associated lipoprotein [Desulfobaculum bizertense DSM 18034]